FPRIGLPPRVPGGLLSGSTRHDRMMKRTHHCAQLTKADLGSSVSLSGWIDSIRDHGGIIFIDLRDRMGVTQVKFDPAEDPELGARAARLRPESVISVWGKVEGRPE